MELAAIKVTFVHSENESLAVETLSAVLKERGHTVALVYDHRYFERSGVSLPTLARIFDARDLLAQEVVDDKPDLVCFSVHTNAFQWALDISRRIRSRSNVPILFGGVHPISVPDITLAQTSVDMVCVGEGERPLLELVQQIDKYPDIDVPGIWMKRDGELMKSGPAPLVSDLDSLPFPDKELFYNRLPWLSQGYLIVTGRGCPYACTFCGNDVLRRSYKGLGRYVRKRSVDNVMEEIIRAKRLYSPRFFNILDDCFNSDGEWLEEFCRRYRRDIGLPFMALTRPQLVDDNEMRQLKEAGCVRIAIGVESTSELTRKQTLNRNDTNHHILNAARIMHKYDLPFSICHILGLPGEGAEEYRHALDFYNELRPSVINPFWLVYFPGTRIVDIAMREGLIDQEDRHLIDMGLANTSQNIGIGRGKRMDQVMFTNYAFLMGLLPILPKRVMQLLINRNVFFEGWHTPVFLITAVRILALVRNKSICLYPGIASGIVKNFFKVGGRIAFLNLASLRKKSGNSLPDRTCMT